MAVAIIADAHLGGVGGEAVPLVAQLDALADEGCERLILLGDLFQIWVGDRRFETPDLALVVESLVRLRAAGVRIEYIEGNRDFFLGAGAYAEAFDLVGLETEFEAGGRRFLAVHGDGLDAKDYRYRFWRAVSKSRLSEAALKLVPGALAYSIIHSTERNLAKTNFKHKIRIPEEAVRAYGAGRLAEGYDELVLGHFHKGREWSLPEGTIRILEPWFESRRVEWFR